MLKIKGSARSEKYYFMIEIIMNILFITGMLLLFAYLFNAIIFFINYAHLMNRIKTTDKKWYEYLAYYDNNIINFIRPIIFIPLFLGMRNIEFIYSKVKYGDERMQHARRLCRNYLSRMLLSFLLAGICIGIIYYLGSTYCK